MTAGVPADFLTLYGGDKLRMKEDIHSPLFTAVSCGVVLYIGTSLVSHSPLQRGDRDALP